MGQNQEQGEKTTVLITNFYGSYKYNMSEYFKLTQSIPDNE